MDAETQLKLAWEKFVELTEKNDSESALRTAAGEFLSCGPEDQENLSAFWDFLRQGHG